MNNITYKVITDLEEAKNAWINLSPNQYLHDDWDFRYLYYKYFNYPLFFYAAYDNQELVALLPLMLDETSNKLEFFANFDYMENNRVFFKSNYDFLAEKLIQMIDKPYKLNYMDPSMSKIKGATVHDENFYIDLSNMESYKDFFNLYLSTERRKKLNKIISEIDFETEVSTDIEYMKTLADFSKKRFGSNSSFNDRPHWLEYMTDIAKNFDSRIVVLRINNEIQGVGLTINYNNSAYGLITGYNNEISNLGKLMIIVKIDQAIKDKQKIYDSLGGGAYGWKTDFHLLTRPFYQIESK